MKSWYKFRYLNANRIQFQRNPGNKRLEDKTVQVSGKAFQTWSRAVKRLLYSPILRREKIESVHLEVYVLVSRLDALPWERTMERALQVSYYSINLHPRNSFRAHFHAESLRNFHLFLCQTESNWLQNKRETVSMIPFYPIWKETQIQKTPYQESI